MTGISCNFALFALFHLLVVFSKCLVSSTNIIMRLCHLSENLILKNEFILYFSKDGIKYGIYNNYETVRRLVSPSLF